MMSVECRWPAAFELPCAGTAKRRFLPFFRFRISFLFIQYTSLESAV
jgi:hypothetical protein